MKVNIYIEKMIYSHFLLYSSSLLQIYGSDRQIPDSSQTATALMCGAKTNFYIVGYNDNVKQGDCAAETPANKLTSILDHFLADGR